MIFSHPSLRYVQPWSKVLALWLQLWPPLCVQFWLGIQNIKSQNSKWWSYCTPFPLKSDLNFEKIVFTVWVKNRCLYTCDFFFFRWSHTVVLKLFFRWPSDLWADKKPPYIIGWHLFRNPTVKDIQFMEWKNNNKITQNKMVDPHRGATARLLQCWPIYSHGFVTSFSFMKRKNKIWMEKK